MRNLCPFANFLILPADFVIDIELVLLGGLLLIMIFVGYAMVRRVRDWQKDEEASAVTPQQQLEQYRALLDEGLLRPEEFEQLRRKLEGVKSGNPEKPPDGSPPAGSSG